MLFIGCDTHISSRRHRITEVTGAGVCVHAAEWIKWRHAWLTVHVVLTVRGDDMT